MRYTQSEHQLAYRCIQMTQRARLTKIQLAQTGSLVGKPLYQLEHKIRRVRIHI